MLIQIFIVQVVTFLAIVIVLRKFLYAESVKETQRLNKLKEETSTKQRELQEKIEQAQAAYDEKMAEAEKNVRMMNSRTESESKELRKKVLEKAKQDADNIMKAAFNAKEKMREEIAVEMIQGAPRLAVSVFAEVLSPAVKEAVHRELVGQVHDKIKGLDRATFKTHIEKGEVHAAFPLGQDDRQSLEASINTLLGYDVPLTYQQAEAITGGLVLKLGSILIDGSLENRMRQAQREMTGSLSMTPDHKAGLGKEDATS